MIGFGGARAAHIFDLRHLITVRLQLEPSKPFTPVGPIRTQQLDVVWSIIFQGEIAASHLFYSVRCVRRKR